MCGHLRSSYAVREGTARPLETNRDVPSRLSPDNERSAHPENS